MWSLMRAYYYIILSFLFLCCGFILYSYFSPKIITFPRDRCRVVCTTSMLADVVRTLGGEHVDVIGLMGPGVDPHLYRAREGDVHRLASADVVLYHGLHLEGRLTDVMRAMQRYAPTYAVCEKIPAESLKESDYKGMFDPHIWHDIRLWMYVVDAVRDALMQCDGAHAHVYIDNAARYQQELMTLHEWVVLSLEAVPLDRRILVTAHDAFAYFGAAYGLEVVALQGISTESDISTRDVIDLTTFIVDHKVKTLFLESSISSRNIEAVQQAVQARGWQVNLGDELYSDALGDKDSGADTYIKMIQHNVEAILRGLI